MVRPINHKQLLRILKGEDLEFRITNYPVTVSGTLKLEDLTFPHDLAFKESNFEALEFKNCRFLGKLSLRNSDLKVLKFESCEFSDLEIDKSHIKELTLNDSTKLHKFNLGASSVNNLEIKRNSQFQAIEVACENNIMSAFIEDNGNGVTNSFKSTIYICPERFDNMVLKNNISEILHIGTIGQYSSFEIDNHSSNLVLFSNCNGANSKVNFKNLQPLDPFLASVCIVNSDRIIELKQNGVFSKFKNIKKYDQSVDLRNYSRIAG